MSRVAATLSAAALLALSAIPASAGCANCYVPAPQPCVTAIRPSIVPPQYRTVQRDRDGLSRAGRVAHRMRRGIETVMVPKTVMVSPGGVQYEQVPAQYATAPARRDGGARRRPTPSRCVRAAAIAAGNSFPRCVRLVQRPKAATRQLLSVGYALSLTHPTA